METSIGIREEYTDNFYLEEDPNANDNFITTVEAGIKFPSISERRGFEGEYVGKFIYHHKYSREDRIEQRGNFESKFGFGKRDVFSVNVDGRQYYNLKDPWRFEEPTNLSQIKILSISPSLKLLLTRGEIETGYQYIIKRYKDPEYTDNNVWRFFCQVNRDVGRRISTMLGYTLLNRNFKTEGTKAQLQDYQEQSGNIGINAKMPLDISGHVSYGYVWRKYDQGDQTEYYTLEGNLVKAMGRKISANFSYGIGQYEEVGEYVYGNEKEFRRWGGETKIILKTRHVLHANYKEGVYQDLDGTLYERRHSNIGIVHDLHGKINLEYGAYTIEDDYKDDIRKDDTQGLKTVFEVFFTKVFSINVSGNYEEKTFDPVDWRDRYIKGIIGLKYDIFKWLPSNLNYTYIKNKSNQEEREYTNNRYSVELKGYF